MLYLPTVNLWHAGTHKAVTTGQLKLAVGQWLQCGAGPKSRFVSVSQGGIINAVHWQGTADATRTRFTRCCFIASLGKQYASKAISLQDYRAALHHG